MTTPSSRRPTSGERSRRARFPTKLVVVPDYRAGAATRLEPLSRAEAAVLLAEQSFNFNDLGAPGLFAIGELVRGCTCHRLTYSDLAAGVTCVSDLLPA